MADVCDDYGNPVVLTDQHGNPVELTDEHGKPMHLYGVATTAETATHGGPTITHTGPGGYEQHGGAPAVSTDQTKTDYGTGHGGAGLGAAAGAGGAIKAATHGDTGYGGPTTGVPHGGVTEHRTGLGGVHHEPVQRSSSSSSSSSEDDGQGGRIKKKKGLKEKIKEKLSGGGKHKEGGDYEGGHVSVTKVSTASVAEEHQKKSMMEKIMEKLPGHHTH